MAASKPSAHPASEVIPAVLSIVVTMVVILVFAAAVVLYVAYPHRGQDVPAARWLGEALRRGVESMPALREPEDTVRRR